jgi:hydrogenase expression/formation protein HypC
MCLAIPGKVISIEESDTVAGGQLATVDFDGSRVEVSLTMVPEARLGSWVLVHAGYAIEVLDEEEAGKTWDWLKQADLVEEVPVELKGHGSDNG